MKSAYYACAVVALLPLAAQAAKPDIGAVCSQLVLAPGVNKTLQVKANNQEFVLSPQQRFGPLIQSVDISYCYTFETNYQKTIARVSRGGVDVGFDASAQFIGNYTSCQGIDCQMSRCFLNANGQPQNYRIIVY